MVNRLRSPSSASLASNKSQDVDFSEVENWFYGFRKYNQLVTTKISPEQAYPSSEFSKASKALTKNLGGQFIHGLPEATFDLSLLWCPAGTLTRKTDGNEPSWSWTAYDGPVNFPFDHTSCPDYYKIPRTETELFRSEIVNFHIGPAKDPYTIRREKGEKLRMKLPSWFHAPRGSDSSIESNTLRFTAATISADRFRADPLVCEEEGIMVKQLHCSELSNDQNQHCGVFMEGPSILEPSEDGPFEFVLLSRNLRAKHDEETRKPKVPTMHPPGTPVWDGECFVWDLEVTDFDETLYEPGPWKMLNVMLIKWVGDYAVRLAIARIHEDAWNAESPVRKEIVLR